MVVIGTDIGVAVKAVIKNGKMDVWVQIPRTLLGSHLEGLLGSYDDNKDNDIIDSNGKTYSVTSAKPVDYHKFGESCMYILTFLSL